MAKLFGIPVVGPAWPATQPVASGPATFEATTVKQLPIQNFGGDITVGASADIFIDATLPFSSRCTGMLLQGITGTVQVSINGSAFRTVITDQAINDASIQTVRVQTAALSSVIVQLHGV